MKIRNDYLHLWIWEVQMQGRLHFLRVKADMGYFFKDVEIGGFLGRLVIGLHFLAKAIDGHAFKTLDCSLGF
jgi:hypothetical protein